MISVRDFVYNHSLGSLLKIITKMLASLVKFFLMIILVIFAFACGFFFIVGVEGLLDEGMTDPDFDFTQSFVETFNLLSCLSHFLFFIPFL